MIVTGYQESKLYHILNNKYHFENDSRIKFVGTIYDDALLKSVRKNAFAYLHGHEVGGTNPSLLEALGSTSLNLLLNSFSKSCFLSSFTLKLIALASNEGGIIKQSSISGKS